MSSFLESVKKLKENDEFKKTLQENPDIFLSNGFIIYENENSTWQLGYYSKEKNKFFNFVLKEKIYAEESQKFSEEEVKKLNLKKIKTDIKDILLIIEKNRKKKYSLEKIEKIIIILQTIKNQTIWNTTCLTKNFKTINIKINAINKKLISSEIKSIFELKKLR